MSDWLGLFAWGDKGWGDEMAYGALMTVGVAAAAFLLGQVFGGLAAWAKLSRSRLAYGAADAYTTVVRGIPDLLIIYLLYFGGSGVVMMIARQFGHTGFIEVNAFATGAIAIGVIAGAYSSEVIRGAYLAIAKGEIEAAKAFGMGRWTMLRRVLAPQILRFALPGLGNVWQVVLKDTALISVTGLVEIMRQARMGAGATKEPFPFFVAAGILYLLLTTVSSWAFRRAEARAMRGVRRG
jgi:octopine/nopaline transport system permease protein